MVLFYLHIPLVNMYLRWPPSTFVYLMRKDWRVCCTVFDFQVVGC